MEGLVLLLSGVVVKTALRLWIGDNSFAENLSVDLTDLIRDRVSNVLDQRKLRNRFASIEEIVADLLLSSLRNEFRSMDEGDANAAVTAVTDTFNRARLTDRVLFAGDLDSVYLNRFVRQAAPGIPRDLGSADAIALYDRLTYECCSYVIAIADKLPGFQTGAFAEILRREHQLMDLLEEVLRRLPSPAAGRQARQRVDAAYRQRLVQLFDRLELFGLDFSAQWYDLSIAYVNLTVADQHAGNGAGGTLEDRLVEHPRLLITGRAGSGKTTVLQWLAVRAARKDATGSAQLLNNCTPFFLRLREYVEKPLPLPEEFLDKISPLLAPEDRPWPRQELLSGHAVVLIDGVDELPEAQRPALSTWLDELMRLFPQARYVVTTRPGAMSSSWLDHLGFATATIEPMPPALIRTFVRQWHAAMREWLSDEPAREQLAAFERALVATIESDRFLRDLADTPLLAGLMCALNQHLHGQLPRRRSEIYEKALAMFDQRDRARSIAGDGLSLDLAATTQLLSDFALWLVQEGASEASAKQAENAFARSSAVLPGGPWQAALLYRHLLLRSGLLREPTAGQVDFVHRTFQEYLAAKALIAADHVGELVRNAADDQWREVVILASGQGNVKQTTALLRGLLRPAWKGGQRYRRRLLAVACLQEIRGIDPDVLAAVERAIPDLLPPRSTEQAEALSAAGDRLLPLLAQNLPESNGEKVAAIRAAALIGGDDAMPLIAVFARGGDFKVEQEAVRSWPYFDPAAYVDRVLSEIRPAVLELNDMQVVPLLDRAPYIRHLTLRLSQQKIPDLTALRGCELTALDLWYAADQTPASLVSIWPRLKELSIFGWQNLRDISAIAHFPELTSLRVGWVPKVRSLAVLSELTELVRLSLFGHDNLDMSPLSLLPKLQRIYLNDCGDVDVTPLASMNVNLVIVDKTQIVGERGSVTVSDQRRRLPRFS